MYIDTDNTESSNTSLTFTFTGMRDRRWRIGVSYIHCGQDRYIINENGQIVLIIITNVLNQ